MARAGGRARPNLGLHRSRLAPDRNSLCAGAGTRGAWRACATQGRHTGQGQVHGEGPCPCGKGRPAILSSTTTTIPAPAGQFGPARLQRSWRASGPPWRAGVPPTFAGGAWGYLGLAQRAGEHREDVSSSRRVYGLVLCLSRTRHAAADTETTSSLTPAALESSVRDPPWGRILEHSQIGPLVGAILGNRWTRSCPVEPSLRESRPLIGQSLGTRPVSNVPKRC